MMDFWDWIYEYKYMTGYEDFFENYWYLFSF